MSHHPKAWFIFQSHYATRSYASHIGTRQSKQSSHEMCQINRWFTVTKLHELNNSINLRSANQFQKVSLQWLGHQCEWLMKARKKATNFTMRKDLRIAQSSDGLTPFKETWWLLTSICLWHLLIITDGRYYCRAKNHSGCGGIEGSKRVPVCRFSCASAGSIS